MASVSFTAQPSKLAVDPTMSHDAHYRYWMPPVQTKIEGNDNGIKTVFPNLREVCAKINRPAEVLLKHFCYELGAQSTFLKKDDKFLVMGSFTQERVQDRVYDFITRYVLCTHCRSPQTAPYVKADSTKHLCMTCLTCGVDTNLSKAKGSHARLVTLMATLYSHAWKSTAAATQPAMVDRQMMEEPLADSVSILDRFVDAPSQGLPKKNPIVELSNLMRQTPPPLPEKVIHAALQLKTESNLNDNQMARTIFRAIIDGVDGSKFIGTLQQWRAVLKHFIVNKEQTTAIKELGIAVKTFNKPDKFPMALKMLWDEGIVGDVAILDWYVNYKPSGKDISADFVAAIKRDATPFIEWLE